MREQVWHQLTYGVFVCSGMDKGRPVGCIINTAMRVSSEPALFVFSLNRKNYTAEVLKSSGRFALNILAQSAPLELFGVFGFRSGRDTDKFEGVPHTLVEGLPVLNHHHCGALLFELRETLEAGTHTLFLAEMRGSVEEEGETPMSYRYYNEVLKGKVPKTAPSYVQQERAEESPLAVCQVCGYRHNTVARELPEDFTCPICGVDRTQFTDQ